MIMVSDRCFRQRDIGFRVAGAYDLTPGCVEIELVDGGELVLWVAGFGEYASGFGPAAGGGVDQHGFADPGELVQEFTYGQVQPVAVGLQAHQVRDLQGEHAGEGVHPDVVLGPVEHRREGDDVGVFHLPEGAFGFGLGSVAGDHVDDRPVVVVGDDHVFAEDLGSSPARASGSMFQLRRRSLGCSPVSCQVITRRTQAS